MSSTFDDALTAFNAAHHDYVNGNPGPALAVFSRRDDVSLCNPVGPPVRGLASVERAATEPSRHFSDGKVIEYEEVSRFVTDDLGYVVRIERGQAHIDGSPEPVPFSLRVTMIFRPEGDSWKIAHRHADPITAQRPLESSFENQH